MDFTPMPGAAGEREAVARAMACEDLGYLTPFMQSNWLERADRALSALAPRRAAEILAAEANERARILSDAAIEAAREYLALCGHEPISDIFIEGAIKEAIKAGERNEHGAGK